MKTIFITLALTFAFVLSSEAKMTKDLNNEESEPIVSAKLDKSEVPAAVVNAVDTHFDRNNPTTWTRFPASLNEYGWVYDFGGEEIIERYEVTMKTDRGSDLWAIYSSSGELLQTREVLTNRSIPKDIMDQFLASQYNDWNIVGNREIVKFYNDNNRDRTKIAQDFRLTVEKDGVRKNLSFNWKSTN